MKLGVFYHCKLCDGRFEPGTNHSGYHIRPEFAVWLMCKQMNALTQSGLANAAEEIIVGVNGGTDSANLARCFSPAKASVVVHGENATTEIPTMKVLREWLQTHRDWYVCYHHIKGVTHPENHLYDNWRQRLENIVIWNWRKCVTDLDSGYDSVSGHWLTPEQFPGAVKSPFWGGTFWWAKAQYLLTLPPLPEPTWRNRFEAESWIGYGPKRPKVRDYHPGWP